MMPFRQRLFVTLLGWLGLVLATFNVALILLVRRELHSDLDQFLRDKAFLMGYQVNPDLRTAVGGDDRVWRTDRYLSFGQTRDADWSILYKSARLAEPIPPTDEIKRLASHSLGVVVHDAAGKDGTAYRMATIRIERKGKFICYSQLAVKIADRDRPLRELVYWLTGGSALALALGGLGLNYLLRQWAAPLDAIAQTARQIHPGSLARQRLFAPADAPELAQLASAFNGLLDRLEAAHASQDQFVADASHELRTPLAALRAEIEVCLRRERPPEVYRAALHSSQQELERLTALVENLLALACLDAKPAGQQPAPVDLAVACRVVVEQLAPLAGANGLRLLLDVPDELPVAGDAPGLERAIRNLVENAIRHTPGDEEIIIRAVADHDRAIVQIIDCGVGIAPEHLPRIFDRFYRVDTARTRMSGGAGLGLSFVKAIIEAHGGTMSVRSQPGEGSTFEFSLQRLPGGMPPAGARPRT